MFPEENFIGDAVDELFQGLKDDFETMLNEEGYEPLQDALAEQIGVRLFKDESFTDKSTYSRYDYCVNIGTGTMDIDCPKEYQLDFLEYYQEDDMGHSTYLDTVRKYMRKDCKIVPEERGYGISDKVRVVCSEE